MRNRKIVFGRGVEVLGRGEKAAASVNDKTAGGRDSERSGDVDGKYSSGNFDSNRVEGARLTCS